MPKNVSKTQSRETYRARSWREEKIFIVFSPRATQRTLKLGADIGDWIVTEPKKPVYRGQTVEWQAVGPCKKLELDLPGVFEPPLRKVGTDTVEATVRRDAPKGYYEYEAYCNGQLAIGGSSPGVIVDP